MIYNPEAGTSKLIILVCYDSLDKSVLKHTHNYIATDIAFVTTLLPYGKILLVMPLPPYIYSLFSLNIWKGALYTFEYRLDKTNTTVRLY